MRLIKTFLIFFVTRCCLAVICYPPRGGVLPLQPHCRELVRRLLDAARSPGGLANMEWGRTLDNTPTTVHLPKVYWIAGGGQRTCGAIVDVEVHSPEAVERFNLAELGHAVEHIENACLFRKFEVGVERVGPGKKVEVRLERVDLEAMPTSQNSLVHVGLGHGRYLFSSEPMVPEGLTNRSRAQTP